MIIVFVAVERASGVVEKTGGGGYIDRMRGVTEVLKWLAINFRDSVTHLFSRWLAFRQAHLVMCKVSSKPTSTWISFWAPRRYCLVSLIIFKYIMFCMAIV